jgi:hypothetical protein
MDALTTFKKRKNEAHDRLVACINQLPPDKVPMSTKDAMRNDICEVVHCAFWAGFITHRNQRRK